MCLVRHAKPKGAVVDAQVWIEMQSVPAGQHGGEPGMLWGREHRAGSSLSGPLQARLGEGRPPEEQQSIELPYLPGVREAER